MHHRPSNTLIMEQKLFIYNTLSRKKEEFKPITPGRVGMYVCGPTVYGDAHLGHARPAITFDLLFRYLQHIGYKVRYVRNITDVGHLEHDADEGEDKIAKKARLEELEPMEVAQYYTNRFHAAMEALNVLPPSIEPHATGHIIEQIELVRKSWITVMPTSVRAACTSMWRNTTRRIITASFPDAIWRMSSTTPGLWTAWERSITKWISLYGSVPSLNISCVGPVRGATVSLVGIASVRPWAASTWATISTSTVEEWT